MAVDSVLPVTPDAAAGGLVVTLRDPAERRAVHSPSRLAAVRATGLLDTGADPGFDRLASLAATLLEAPFAFVTLLDDRRSFWKACIGIESDDPADRQNTVEQSFCRYVVASREPLIVDDAALHPVTRDNPSIELMGVRAWAGFPVFDGNGEALGSFCVVDTVPRTWTDRDVDVLATLSKAAASEFAVRSALAAARAAERSASSLARTLQESLLPPVAPEIPGLDVAARYLPAGSGLQVGGDFYDVFRLAGRNRWAAVIGDVSGHGVEAAKITALARHTVRAGAMTGGSPRRVLELLNQALLGQDEPDGDEEPRHLTAVYVQLALSGTDGVVARVAGAGHCPVLVRRADGHVDRLCPPGTALGWFPDPGVRDVRVTLRPGDALVLHTDGLTEARRDGEMLGEDAVVELLRRTPADVGAADLAALLVAAGTAHGGPQPQDDTAVLVLAVPGPTPPVAIPLPTAPTA